MRTAFGTFFRLPDPASAFGDADYVRSRFTAEPRWAVVAVLDGEVVGSNFATRWGSFGFFGPLSVRPDLWDRGIATRLVAAAVEMFDAWPVRQAGLFTFADSARHHGLYQKFGFWPQQLTPVMGKPIAPNTGRYDSYAAAAEGERRALRDDCRAITDAIFAGLDVEHEIRSTHAQALGDTVLVYEGSTLVAFAVCHVGAGEAGSGVCYVKFGAVRPGADAGERFERLLDACEALAGARGATRISAGVNMARHDAYRRLLARGYRTGTTGVVMQRPNEAGYYRPDVYVIDDLR